MLAGDVEEQNVASEGDDPKPRVQSAVRTIAILLAIADCPSGLNAKEITERLGYSRQVTYHLIHTMRGTGIIRKDERNKYVLGLAAASIVEGFGRQLTPSQYLARRVRSVVTLTGETAYASGWVDGEIVALTTAPGQSPIGAAQIPQGYSGHAHARAAGKLLLAHAEPSMLETYLANHPLEPRTHKTITDPAAFMKELEKIRTTGYSFDDEEFHEGLKCLAVPIEESRCQFVLGISVPKERFESNFARYLAALHEAAKIDP